MILTDKQKQLISLYKEGYRTDKKGNIIFKNKKIKLYKNRMNTFSENKYSTFSQFNIRVHRFVGYQKFGKKIFEKGIQIRHLNGNSLDNSWDNIGIGNAHDNQMDVPIEKRMEHALKATLHIRKFTDLEIEKIRIFYKRHKSYKITMEKFNITSKGTMNYIIHHYYKSKK